MTDKVEKIKAEFNMFVDKYIEFCNSKIFESNASRKSFDRIELEEKAPTNTEKEPEETTEKKNCLESLDDVGDIIDKLFDSEINFIKQMEKDIENFNKLYDCFQFGNLDNKGETVTATIYGGDRLLPAPGRL